MKCPLIDLKGVEFNNLTEVHPQRILIYSNIRFIFLCIQPQSHTYVQITIQTAIHTPQARMP